MSEATHRLVLVEASFAGEYAVKGKAEPQKCGCKRRWRQSRGAFVFPFQYTSGSLPTKIEPRNSVAFHYDLSTLGAPPKLACFLATSADARGVQM